MWVVGRARNFTLFSLWVFIGTGWIKQEYVCHSRKRLNTEWLQTNKEVWPRDHVFWGLFGADEMRPGQKWYTVVDQNYVKEYMLTTAGETSSLASILGGGVTMNLHWSIYSKLCFTGSLISGSSLFYMVWWSGLYADLAFLVYLGQYGANRLSMYILDFI